MTIQEAISELEFDKMTIFTDPNSGMNLKLGQISKGLHNAYTAYEIAIEALTEVEQYRKIGTVEECRAAMRKLQEET